MCIETIKRIGDYAANGDLVAKLLSEPDVVEDKLFPGNFDVKEFIINYTLRYRNLLNKNVANEGLRETLEQMELRVQDFPTMRMGAASTGKRHWFAIFDTELSQLLGIFWVSRKVND